MPTDIVVLEWRGKSYSLINNFVSRWGEFDMEIVVYFSKAYGNNVVKLTHSVTFPPEGKKRMTSEKTKVHFLSGGGGAGSSLPSSRTNSPVPPTLEVLKTHIRNIVKESGAQGISSKQIRATLRERLNIDVSAQKTAIKALIEKIMNEEHEKGANSEGKKKPKEDAKPPQPPPMAVTNCF